MTTLQNPTEVLDDAQQRLAAFFVQMCSDPDDGAAAQGADEALHQLDALLASVDG